MTVNVSRSFDERYVKLKMDCSNCGFVDSLNNYSVQLFGFVRELWATFFICAKCFILLNYFVHCLELFHSSVILIS